MSVWLIQSPDRVFAKDRGVETTGNGSASYRFDNTSGSYDIHITYFDAENGQIKAEHTLPVSGMACFCRTGSKPWGGGLRIRSISKGKRIP